MAARATTDADKSARPVARSIWARQPSTRSAAEQSAVMCRTSPRRYSPVTTGAGPPKLRLNSAAISPDGHHPRCADVQRRQPYREPGVKRRGHRSSHIRYVDEVAALATVLEDARSLTTQQAVGEDRRHSGVRSVSRHPRAIDVVEAQGGDGAAGLPAPDRRQLLPVCFRCRIDVARIERRRLRYQFGSQLSTADRAQGIEAPSIKIVPTAWWRANGAVFRTAVAALTVDDHRGGVHEPRDACFSCHAECHRRAVIVVQRVIVDVEDADP